MIGIIGARGVGKTTMILQYIKEHLDSKKALYVSAMICISVKTNCLIS